MTEQHNQPDRTTEQPDRTAQPTQPKDRTAQPTGAAYGVTRGESYQSIAP
jgi:hypothetical protein